MTIATLTPSAFDPAGILLAIAKHSKARCSARAVLSVLAGFARFSGGGAGTCYPSMKRLAELSGVTVRTVRRAIARLIELGEIEVLERGSGRRNTLYRLSILVRSKVSSQGGQKRPPNSLESTDTPYPQKRAKRQRRFSKRSRSSLDSHSQNAAAHPTPSPKAPAWAEGPGYAESGLKRSSGDPAPVQAMPARPAKWRALTIEQVQEAQAACDPAQWGRYRLAAGLDGVATVDLDAVAAHQWRADAIMRGRTVSTLSK